MRIIGDWENVDHLVDRASQRAAAANFKDDGRKKSVRLANATQGFIGELYYAEKNWLMPWWDAKHDRMERLGLKDDGGEDFPGIDVKVATYPASIVSAGNWARAPMYVVYEYLYRRNDMSHHLRQFGYFLIDDIHDIAYPNGFETRGVYVSELR